MPMKTPQPFSSLRRLLLTLAMLVAVAALPEARAAKVYVQDSPDAVKLLAHANDRLERDEPEEAVRLVQEVIDEHGTKLLERAEGRFAEARRVAALMLAEHPRLLEAYQSLYNPTAAQMLKEAGRDGDALAAVIDQYGMTSAGYDAGLRLAGLHLESGQPQGAGVVLERLSDHPASNAGTGRWVELSAAAALLQRDRERYDAFRKRLNPAQNADAIARLDSMAEALNIPSKLHELSPLGSLPAASPPDDVARPLWSMSVGGAEAYMIRMGRNGRTNGFDTLADQGQLLNTMTVVYGDRLFINSGERVYAVEPISGRQMWETQIGPETAGGRNQANLLSQVMRQGADLSGVTTDGQRVYAIAGLTASLSVYSSYYPNIGKSDLVGLDAKTGEKIWAISPEVLEADLKSGSWYGRPIAWQGHVYAMIRRRQRFNFQDAYLVCLDGATGKAVWRRHLGSTAVANSRSKPATATMSLDAGWLYIDSGLGTVAKVSASNGMVQWLVTHDLPDQPTGSMANRPWGISAPIIVEAGVVVYSEWDDAIRVYKPATGELVDSLSATRRWDAPMYLAKAGEDVLAVGLNTGLYDGKSLENKWRYRLPGTLRGRAAVTDGRLYLPADKRVVVLDSNTGRELATREVEMPATLLALDGQLIAAQRHRISAYTSWDIALTQLQKQIEANPIDHRPLMALAWLAYGHDRPGPLLDALDRATALARTSPDAEGLSDDLYGQVLKMATEKGRTSNEIREGLFERLAGIADSPADEVTYHLAFGKHLESTQRTTDAIDHYQQILAESEYRQQLYRHSAGHRQAGVEAEQRLRSLIDKFGDELYAEYDATADRRLRALAGQGDPKPLEELAAMYPTSKSAINALRVAAERAVQRDQKRRAIANLARAGKMTRDPRELAFIIGRQAELLAEQGEPAMAAMQIRRLLTAHPGTLPVRADSPTEPEGWLKELDDAARKIAQPQRLGLPLTGRGRTVGAKLLAGPLRGVGDPGQTILLFASARTIEARRSNDLAVLWTVPFAKEDAKIELVSADARRICVRDTGDGRIAALDTATGRLLWADETVDKRLDSIPLPDLDGNNNGRNGIQVRGGFIQPGNRAVIQGNVVMINGRIVRGGVPAQQAQVQSGPLVVASDDAVVVADSRGRVLTMSADRGGVRWQTATLVRSVNILKLWGDQLVIAGLDESQNPLLCVYDARSGTLLHRITKPKLQPFRWVGLTRAGRLVYIGDTQVEAFDLVRGQTVWTAEPNVRLSSTNGGVWMGDERVIVRTSDGDLIFVDLESGDITGRRPMRKTIEGVMSVAPVDDKWLMTGDDRCSMIDASGHTIWVAVIAEPVAIIDQVVTERHVVLLVEPVRHGNAPDGGHERRIHIIDRATGAMRYQTAVTSNSPFDRMTVSDGRLVLGGGSITALLDGASE